MRLALTLSASLVAALLAPHEATAAGFQIREQTAEGLGRAYSGEAVIASDASGLWFNPAQAARLQSQATATLSAISLDASLVDAGSTLAFADGTTVPTGGPNGEDPIDFTLLPAVAGVWRLGDRVAVGLSANVPFGLEVEYDEGFFGRFDGSESELVTADLSATLAFNVTPSTSVGGSFHVQYVEADLSTALPDPLGRGVEGVSVLEGNNYGTGWSVGVLQDFGEHLSIGASYRSEVEHGVRGSVIVEGLTAPFDVANGRTEASTDITLPDSARVGVAIKPVPEFTLSAQVEWVGWSDFQSLDVLLEDTGTVSETPFLYRDATNFGIGLDWAQSEALTFRAGYSSDPTPTRDGERSTRVPDADREWFTLGATYRFGGSRSGEGGFKLDAGLAYIDADTVDVATDRTAFEGQPFAVGIATRGTLRADAVVGSLGLSKRF